MTIDLVKATSIIQEIKKAFDKEAIEILFLHVSLYACEATKPFPIIEKGKE